MTYKITTDFAGTESLATTKTRLESILDFWLGSGSTNSVSTWGDVRTLLNSVAPAAITIADGELASSFRTKLNTLNSTDGVVSNLLFNADEPGVWYDPSDLTTLFQDTAGTTPVTTPGQTVGLMLDKSKGLTLGPELVTNGTFAADTTGWIAAASTTLSVNSGSMVVTNGATTFGYAHQAISTVVGETYTVLFSVTGGTSTGLLFIGTTVGGSQNYSSPARGVGDYTVRFVATATTTYLRFGLTQDTSGATVQFDNISVKELPGFHATQATAAARPTYGIVPETGRRNLTDFSQLLSTTVASDQGYYANNTTGTRTGSSGVVNDDTETPEIPFYWRTTGTAYDLFGVTPAGALISGQTYILKMRVRSFGADITSFSNVAAWASSITSSSGFPVTSAQGWKDVTVVFVSNGSRVIVGPTGNNSNWGYVRFQVEVGSTATDYQRVTTQFDVTEAGVPSLGYLSFDGVDDFLVTPTITPGTDKVQVFAGVRKLTESSFPVIVETSTSWGTNNGSFSLGGGNSNGYSGGSRGTVSQSLGNGSAGPSAPDSAALTFTGDISGDNLTLGRNGTQVAQNTADQGTGNYLAYPMYIGRRGGTSSPFNGHVYSLITRFGPNLSSDVIGRAETYTAQKTGVTL